MKLTDKQEAFAVEFIMNGRNATAAYRKIYDTKTDKDCVVWVAAHKVLHNNKVSIRVKELSMVEHSEHILTIQERKRLLSTYSLQGDIKSIDLLNKMEDVYGVNDDNADKQLRVTVERISKS